MRRALILAASGFSACLLGGCFGSSTRHQQNALDEVLFSRSSLFGCLMLNVTAFACIFSRDCRHGLAFSIAALFHGACLATIGWKPTLAVALLAAAQMASAYGSIFCAWDKCEANACRIQHRAGIKWLLVHASRVVQMAHACIIPAAALVATMRPCINGRQDLLDVLVEGVRVGTLRRADIPMVALSAALLGLLAYGILAILCVDVARACVIAAFFVWARHYSPPFAAGALCAMAVSVLLRVAHWYAQRGEADEDGEGDGDQEACLQSMHTPGKLRHEGFKAQPPAAVVVATVDCSAKAHTAAAAPLWQLVPVTLPPPLPQPNA